MQEDNITKRILAFVKKLDSGDCEEALLKAAIAKNWLDDTGNPTVAGRELARSFDDLDSLTN